MARSRARLLVQRKLAIPSATAAKPTHHLGMRSPAMFACTRAARSPPRGRAPDSALRPAPVIRCSTQDRCRGARSLCAALLPGACEQTAERKIPPPKKSRLTEFCCKRERACEERLCHPCAGRRAGGPGEEQQKPRRGQRAGPGRGAEHGAGAWLCVCARALQRGDPGRRRFSLRGRAGELRRGAGAEHGLGGGAEARRLCGAGRRGGAGRQARKGWFAARRDAADGAPHGSAEWARGGRGAADRGARRRGGGGRGEHRPPPAAAPPDPPSRPPSLFRGGGPRYGSGAVFSGGAMTARGARGGKSGIGFSVDRGPPAGGAGAGARGAGRGGRSPRGPRAGRKHAAALRCGQRSRGGGGEAARGGRGRRRHGVGARPSRGGGGRRGGLSGAF